MAARVGDWPRKLSRSPPHEQTTGGFTISGRSDPSETSTSHAFSRFPWPVDGTRPHRLCSISAPSPAAAQLSLSLPLPPASKLSGLIELAPWLGRIGRRVARNEAATAKF